MFKNWDKIRKVFAAGIAAAVLLTFIIWLLGPLAARFPKPDHDEAWFYFWQLPEPSFWAQVTSWGFYLAHQVTVWVLIALAVRKTGLKMGYTGYNTALLLVNLGFIILHMVQTYIWYDGLAQDTPVWSSQGSVIIMLLMVLVMMNRHRGLFLGLKFPFPQASYDGLRIPHGFYIAWAVIYTFWFHPVEAAPQHIMGFFYIFLLFIQLSMFNTRLHFNKNWIVFLEFFVTIHGTMVAVSSGQTIWPMFLFGFLFLFIFTQQFALPWLAKWARFGLVGLFVVTVVVFYGFRGFNRIFEVFAIPLIEIPGAIALGLFFALAAVITRRLSKGRVQNADGNVPRKD